MIDQVMLVLDIAGVIVIKTNGIGSVVVVIAITVCFVSCAREFHSVRPFTEASRILYHYKYLILLCTFCVYCLLRCKLRYQSISTTKDNNLYYSVCIFTCAVCHNI